MVYGIWYMVYGRWYMVQTSSSTSVALHGHFSDFSASRISLSWPTCWPSQRSPDMMIIVSTCRLLDFPLKVADFWRQSSEEFLSAVTCLNVQHRRQNQIIQNLHICLRLGSHKAWTLAITSAVTLSASIPDQDGDDKGDHQLMMMIISLIKMVIREVIFNWLW